MGPVYQTTNARFPFNAPTDGLIAAERIDVWLQTRQSLDDGVEGFGDTQSNSNPFAMMKAMADHSLSLAKAHATALNDASMSIQEYGWITRQVIGVLNSGDARASEEASALVSAFDDADQKWAQPQQAGQTGAQNLKAMAASVTSAEIKHILEILREREEAFLDTADAFLADSMLLGVVESMSFPVQTDAPASSGAGEPEPDPDSEAAESEAEPMAMEAETESAPQPEPAMEAEPAAAY